VDQIEISDFRILKRVSLDLRPINVFFGANGAGKSTLLDAFAFVRDLVKDGSVVAYNSRGGSFTLPNRRAEGAPVCIRIRSGTAQYQVIVHSHDAGTVVHPNEQLSVSDGGVWHIQFERNGTEVRQYLGGHGTSRRLIDYERSAWYSYFEHAIPIPGAANGSQYVGEPLFRSLTNSRAFHSRSFDLSELRKQGSITNPGLTLGSRGQGLWNCLRNLKDARSTATVYQRILGYLRRAFPQFLEFEFFQAGGSRVGCRIIETTVPSISEGYPVSGAPDGLLQMALNLTAMFAGMDLPRVVLLDEPDLSLHPWALFVLSEAMEEAAHKWSCQLLVATHSPVLLSQFDEESLYLMMPKDGATTIQRVSEMTENRDLLDQYAVGALYMSQLIGEQSSEPMVSVVPIDE
jgi:predicted ATPase